MLFNFKDLIWQFWPQSSGDLLTLADGRQTRPGNISSQNLTSPLGLSHQSVPGGTEREIPAHTKPFSLDFALPRGFLLQLPADHRGLSAALGMKDTKFLLPRSERSSTDPRNSGLD